MSRVKVCKRRKGTVMRTVGQTHMLQREIYSTQYGRMKPKARSKYATVIWDSSKKGTRTRADID